MINTRDDIRDKIREVKERSGGAEAVARFYGLQINSRSHRAICPFHPHGSGTPGENLSFYGGGFVCFVCGAKGSALDYVQRLFQYSTITEAARRLDADMNMDIFRAGPQIRETRAQKMSSDYSEAAENERDNLEFFSAIYRVSYSTFYNEQHKALFALESDLCHAEEALWALEDAEYTELVPANNEKIAEAQRILDAKDEEYGKFSELFAQLPAPDKITDDQLWTIYGGGLHR